MANDDSLRGAWADLRRRTWLFIAVFLSIPLGTAAWSRLGAGLFPGTQGAVFAVFVVIGVASFFATGFWRTMFVCPRCGGYFFQGARWQNPFSRRCLHCGLRIGTP